MNFFNLHTHKFTNQPGILEVVNQYPWDFDATIPFYSIGIHPWHISEDRLEMDYELLEQKVQLPECLALGECGLDKRIEIPFSIQLDVFEKQILVAEKYQKPLILHLVAAFDELIAIKKRLNISVPIVIHGFSKSEQLAKQLIESGFYLSFGKYLLRNPELEAVFKAVPNDKFFLETDTIEETLENVYERAAVCKNMEISTLQKIVASNFKNVFKNNINLK